MLPNGLPNPNNVLEKTVFNFRLLEGLWLFFSLIHQLFSNPLLPTFLSNQKHTSSRRLKLKEHSEGTVWRMDCICFLLVWSLCWLKPDWDWTKPWSSLKGLLHYLKQMEKDVYLYHFAILGPVIFFAIYLKYILNCWLVTCKFICKCFIINRR